MGGNALRTRDSAAAQIGATPEDVDNLVATGRLRVLHVADGSWITTARAVGFAVRGRRPRRRRLRPAPRRRDVASQVARTTSPPPRSEPAPPPQQHVTAPPHRSVAADARIDIEPDRPLDVHAAAAHLGVTPEAALRLMQRGTLRATRLGREWVTTLRALSDHRRTRRPASDGPTHAR